MGYYLGGIAFERKNFNADRIASGIAKQIEHSKKISFKGKITKEGSEWIEQNCESLETDVMKLLNGKYGVSIITDEELGEHYIIVVWSTISTHRMTLDDGLDCSYTDDYFEE